MRIVSSSREQVPATFEDSLAAEPMFYYFAYGSCMCPVDLKRSLGEKTHEYVVGPAQLQGYRLGFYRYWPLRDCGVLDIVKDASATVHGVLYRLPYRLSAQLDAREQGYRHEPVQVSCGDRLISHVRTYVVEDELRSPVELPPNDWYSNVVLRGAFTCGLPEQYCWQLFNHIYQLQCRYGQHHSYQSAQLLQSA